MVRPCICTALLLGAFLTCLFGSARRLPAKESEEHVELVDLRVSVPATAVASIVKISRDVGGHVFSLRDGVSLLKRPPARAGPDLHEARDFWVALIRVCARLEAATSSVARVSGCGNSMYLTVRSANAEALDTALRAAGICTQSALPLAVRRRFLGLGVVQSEAAHSQVDVG